MSQSTAPLPVGGRRQRSVERSVGRTAVELSGNGRRGAHMVGAGSQLRAGLWRARSGEAGRTRAWFRSIGDSGASLSTRGILAVRQQQW